MSFKINFSFACLAVLIVLFTNCTESDGKKKHLLNEHSDESFLYNVQVKKKVFYPKAYLFAVGIVSGDEPLKGDIKSIIQDGYISKEAVLKNSDIKVRGNCNKYFFDKAHRLIEIQNYYKDSILYDIKLVYKDSMASSYFYSRNGLDKTLDSTQFFFDKNGLIRKEMRTDQSGKTLKLYNYDSLGRVTSLLRIMGRDVDTVRCFYKNRGNMNVDSTVYYTFKGPVNKQIIFYNDSLILYELDANSKLGKTYNNHGFEAVSSLSVSVYKYKYDAKGNWIEKKEFIEGKLFGYEKRQIEYY